MDEPLELLLRERNEPLLAPTTCFALALGSYEAEL